jgi:AAA domain
MGDERRTNPVSYGRATPSGNERRLNQGPRDAALGGSPFRLTLFGEIADEHNKEWLIDDFLGVGEMSCWYGFPGAAKSTLVGDAAAHVAAGKAWLGRAVHQGSVLVIAAERSGLVKRRLAAWRKHHGLDDIALGVLDGNSFDLLSNLDHAEHIVAHAGELAAHYECKIVWIIVDTKSQVMGGGNPNEDVDVLRLIGVLKYIQHRLGMPHLSLIDHVPYSSPERMKGSGALGGSIDASFLIKQAGGVRGITIGSKQPNDGPEELDIQFALLSVDVGKATNGKITKAPVVVARQAAAAATKPQAIRLSAEGQKVYAAYSRLLDARKAHAPPNVPGVRPGAKAVTLADLRDQAIAIGLYPHPEPTEPAARGRWLGARRKAWSRGLEAVQAAGMLRLEDGFLWDPRSPAKRNASDGQQDKT